MYFPVTNAVDTSSCEETGFAVVRGYDSPTATHHECDQSAMTGGVYWVYVVNTNLENVSVDLSYAVRLATTEEAHGCYLDAITSGARNIPYLSLCKLMSAACLAASLWGVL